MADKMSIGRTCGCNETVVEITPASTAEIRSKQGLACPDCGKPTKYHPVAVECWDHCPECKRSQNRFWVFSASEFNKAIKDTPRCSFCGGKMETFHFRNRAFEVNVCPEGYP